MKNSKGPKVLLLDIETAPLLGYVWGLWENNVALNQIHTDWYVLCWAAKWLNEPEKSIECWSQRNAKNIEDDRDILKRVWKLLDQADIIVTQNGKSFDQKKLNARFLYHGFQPPSSYRHIDTREIAKRHFAFTSTKLEYMANFLKLKNRKLSYRKHTGFELWAKCLKGVQSAWDEMEQYNKLDVLTLEDLFRKLGPWDTSINFNVYTDGLDVVCKCGSRNFINNGYAYTNLGKYQRVKCRDCGAETRERTNLLSPAKRKSLHSGVK